MNAITHSRWLMVGTLFISVACWPVLAGAEEAASSATTSIVEEFGSVALDSEALDSTRGGAELNLYDIKSDGVVTNNQASNLTTGNNWITDGSLAGAGGFSTVVQNSGNNVLIQNATIINVQVQ